MIFYLIFKIYLRENKSIIGDIIVNKILELIYCSRTWDSRVIHTIFSMSVMLLIAVISSMILGEMSLYFGVDPINVMELKQCIGALTFFVLILPLGSYASMGILGIWGVSIGIYDLMTASWVLTQWPFLCVLVIGTIFFLFVTIAWAS